jgi:hypothetical protein
MRVTRYGLRVGAGVSVGRGVGAGGVVAGVGVRVGGAVVGAGVAEGGGEVGLGVGLCVATGSDEREVSGLAVGLGEDDAAAGSVRTP